MDWGERCAWLQQQVADRDRWIAIDRSIIAQRDARIAELAAENERLSAWVIRAYPFIQAAPCRCGAADECTAHSLIFEYQQALG